MASLKCWLKCSGVGGWTLFFSACAEIFHGELEGNEECDADGTQEDLFQGHWDPESKVDDELSRLLSLREVRDSTTDTVDEAGALGAATSAVGIDARYDVAEAVRHANVSMQPEPILNNWVKGCLEQFSLQTCLRGCLDSGRLCTDRLSR